MPKHINHVVKRLIVYICICLLAGVGMTELMDFFTPDSTALHLHYFLC